MNSAPNNYQQIIQDVLKGFRDIANIVDDLTVHCKGIDEHVERLFAVLEGLRKVAYQGSPSPDTNRPAMALIRAKKRLWPYKMLDRLETSVKSARS